MSLLPAGRRALATVAAAASVATVAAVLTAPAASAAPQPIVGGSTTTAAAYPYVMQITDTSGYQYCGGTLVTSTKVVTAAHCMEGEDAEDVVVVGGRTYRNGTDGTEIEASDIWVHPEYDGATITNDVAVITLAEAMPYQTLPYVGAADTDVYAAGSSARVVGWGTTRENGPSSNQLRTAVVPTVSDADCDESYGTEFDAAAMVCAGLPQGGVDTCQGDSGGPLVLDGRLAGVVSWGYGCARAGYPGVYTRLTSYADDVAAQLGS
ncbi:serine protease [Streptomyces sp. NPDC127098]|uniref:serine protease n=1 Tax=Streptomyces sp. NPDC127098 TaxID=3347137 RepID=UPI003657ED8F